MRGSSAKVARPCGVTRPSPAARRSRPRNTCVLHRSRPNQRATRLHLPSALGRHRLRCAPRSSCPIPAGPPRKEVLRRRHAHKVKLCSSRCTIGNAPKRNPTNEDAESDFANSAFSFLVAGGATTRGQLDSRCRSRCGWRRASPLSLRPTGDSGVHQMTVQPTAATGEVWAATFSSLCRYYARSNEVTPGSRRVKSGLALARATEAERLDAPLQIFLKLTLDVGRECVRFFGEQKRAWLASSESASSCDSNRPLSRLHRMQLRQNALSSESV